jgi:hypothetical protein
MADDMIVRTAVGFDGKTTAVNLDELVKRQNSDGFVKSPQARGKS